jgi:hypothetical protein
MQQILSTYFVQSTALSAEDKVVNKRDQKIPSFMNLISSWKETDNKQISLTSQMVRTPKNKSKAVTLL